MNPIYWAIIVIVILEYLWGQTLSFLSRKASRNPIPAPLKDIYDQDRYLSQQAYFRANSRLGILESAVSTLILLLFFALGGFHWLDTLVSGMTTSLILRSLLFFLGLYLAGFILDIPLSLYRTFVIEERFGFNKTTPRLFLRDLVVSLFLNALILGVIIAAIQEAYLLMPEAFFIVAWGIITLLTLFLQVFYSDLIVPLFNKQTPLEEGSLRSAIEDFAEKSGFLLKNIYVMDSSKRSTKVNAYFTGLGKRKRVVLFDTLIELLDEDEIVAVLAHEIGHYKKRHIIIGFVESTFVTLITFFLLSQVITSQEVALAAGCPDSSFHVNLTVFGLLYTPLSMALGFFSSTLSRRHERQADAFAASYGLGKPLASTLRKMSRKDLANLTPHWLVVRATYSHPTLLERVTTLEDTGNP